MSAAKELTPAIIDRVCAQVARTGEFADQCLVLEGLSMRAARWRLRRGEELQQEHENPKQGSLDELCLSLVAGVQHAEASCERTWVASWNAAIVMSRNGKGAEANAWKERLERRFPDRYKRVIEQKQRDAPVTMDMLVAQRSADKAPK